MAVAVTLERPRRQDHNRDRHGNTSPGYTDGDSHGHSSRSFPNADSLHDIYVYRRERRIVPGTTDTGNHSDDDLQVNCPPILV